MFTKYGWVKHRYVLSERGRNFLKAPWAGGVVLIVCVLIAMLLANLPATATLYHDLLHMDLSILYSTGEDALHHMSGTFPRGMTVEKIINDGLMVIFFFTVGLEIKREITHGQLSTPKKAILPVVAAAGGMLFPALIYTLFNGSTGVAHGWGIPTATDIAFAIGIMSLLGDRVPISLKVFLTALAIADDLGAILVIAMFYGEAPDLLLLGIAVVIMFIVYMMNRMGERRIFAYMIPAVVIWILFYYSGVHATISGVAMAMLIPSKPRYNKAYFLHKADMLEKGILDATQIADSEEGDEMYRYNLRRMKQLCNGSAGMSHRLEYALSPYVTFLIMPIFALANAGVKIESVEYFDIFQYSSEWGSVGMGIFFGLLLGKPLGIWLTSFLAVKCGIAERPSAASWKMLFAVACLGGIGFTMSIFVDSLAFDKQTHAEFIDKGKIAILMGSACAAVVGSALIMIFSRAKGKNK